MHRERTANLRRHLLELLDGGAAHQSFHQVVNGIPAELRGARPTGQSHTPWRLVEHMRIAQHDILQYITEPRHQSPPWPEGFWPDGDAPPDAAAWDRSLELFRQDAQALRALVEDEQTDLLAPLPRTEDHTIFREAVLVSDHNAYHLGQLVTLRKLLGVPVEPMG